MKNTPAKVSLLNLRPFIATSSSIYGSFDEHGPHLAIDGKVSGKSKGSKIGLLHFHSITKHYIDREYILE